MIFHTASNLIKHLHFVVVLHMITYLSNVQTIPCHIPQIKSDAYATLLSTSMCNYNCFVSLALCYCSECSLHHQCFKYTESLYSCLVPTCCTHNVWRRRSVLLEFYARKMFHRKKIRRLSFL